MITRAEFLELHAEFSASDAARVDRFLELAATKIGPAYGDQENDAHRLTAAKMLAQTPFGAQAKLVNADGSTIYDRPLAELARLVGTAKGPME